MGKCIKCEANWTGMAVCHCAGCHETFSSIGAFDKHRTGGGEDRHCRDIEEMQNIGMAYRPERKLWVGLEYDANTPRHFD